MYLHCWLEADSVAQTIRVKELLLVDSLDDS